MDMKHNRITNVEANKGQPVFWQTPCCTFALLCRSEVVLIVSRVFGSVGKPQSFIRVCSRVAGLVCPYKCLSACVRLYFLF